LLTFCVKKVKGLNKVKLVDAGFLWTEPHSRRLKVKVTIQKEVLNGAILQQTFVVEVRTRRVGAAAGNEAAHGLYSALSAFLTPRAQYVVEPHMCEQCQRSNTNSEVWIACVQVSPGLPSLCHASFNLTSSGIPSSVRHLLFHI